MIQFMQCIAPVANQKHPTSGERSALHDGYDGLSLWSYWAVFYHPYKICQYNFKKLLILSKQNVSQFNANANSEWKATAAGWHDAEKESAAP